MLISRIDYNSLIAMIMNEQRASLIRQQQSTPKLHLMVPIEELMSAEMAKEPTNFWDDINGTPVDRTISNMSPELVHEASREWDYGSAADFTRDIFRKEAENKIHAINLSSSVAESQQITNDLLEMHQNLQDRNVKPQSAQKSHSDSFSSSQNQAEYSLDDEALIPDAQAPSCFKCMTEFSFFLRRHHCQICWKVFCKNCSSKTTLTIDGEQKKLNACKKCIQQHKSFSDNLNLQRHLLKDNERSMYKIQSESDRFRNILAENRPTTPMEIKIMEDDYRVTGDGRFGSLDSEQNEEKFMSVRCNDVVRQSAIHKRAMENFLRDTYFETSGSSRLSRPMKMSNKLPVVPQLDPLVNKWLDKKLRGHLDDMIEQVISKQHLIPGKWRKILAACTKHAVMTIKPSSQMLNDSIDFNSFIKIVTVRYQNQEKCQYVNGIVFKKDVASRRMQINIDNPRILLLSSSLGYVYDQEDGFMDMQAEITQQKSVVRIVRQKILSVKPDIIFVEKDASQAILNQLILDKIAVVTMTSEKMLKMIARATQTIVCPSTNLVQKNFVVGQCLNFRVEQVKPPVVRLDEMDMSVNQSLAEHTSLMFIEGCQAKLGCSIVLSGPDMEELKQVRKALKKCLATARTLIEERLLLRFLVPDMKKFLTSSLDRITEDVEEGNDDEPQLTFQVGREDSSPRFRLSQSNHNRHSSANTNKILGSLVSRDSTMIGQEAFEDFLSPYLYHKHMSRSQIVFERFDLVKSGKSVVDFDIDGGSAANELAKTDYIEQTFNEDPNETSVFLQNTSMVQSTSQPHSRGTTTLLDKNVNEHNVKKMLRTMCGKPKRTIVNFFDNASDLSLFTFLKYTAVTAANPCPEESCGKALIQHTTYFYHGTGSVEVKHSQRDKNMAQLWPANTSPEMLLNFPVFIHFYCVECKRVVMSKQQLPAEILEMSFYKFLEQFFYNQEVCMSEGDGSRDYDGAQACSHSVFRDCEFVLSYNAFKTTIKFERQDPYSIDLYHFGLEKGNVSEEAVQSEIQDKVLALRTGFEATFFFIGNKLDQLVAFMEFGEEELPKIALVDVKPSHDALTDFLASFKRRSQNFFATTMKELFGVEVKQNFIKRQELRRSEVDKVSDSFLGDQRGAAQNIKTIMQFNRLHKVLGARTCEYIFLLRKCFYLITTTYLAKILPKKNIFNEAEAATQSHQVSSGYIEVDPSLIAPQQLTASVQASLVQSANSSFSIAPVAKESLMRYNLTEIGNQLSQDSDQNAMKALYKDLLAFEASLSDARYIAELVAANAFLPSGYNQNCVEISRKDALGKSHVDLSALIAVAVGSNLYLNGLSYLDYLDMPACSRHFTGRFEQDSQHDGSDYFKMETENEGGQKKVQLSPDVLNDQIPIEVLEGELLSNSATTFKLSFSTQEAICSNEVIVDGQSRKLFLQGDDEYLEYYARCDEQLDFASVEQPAPLSLFDDYIQVHRQIAELKVTRTNRVTLLMKSNRASSSDELIVNQLANSAKEATKGGHNRNFSANLDGPSSGKEATIPGLSTLRLLKRPRPRHSKKESHFVEDVEQLEKMINHEQAYKSVYHVYHEPLDVQIKIICPKHFEALRKIYCGAYNNFLHSVFRSATWEDNSGGKSNSTFFKSHDNKYVLKGVQKKEFEMFQGMSQSYFEYLGRSFTNQFPTAIAKTLGIFRITMKRRKGQTKQVFLILQENLLINVDEKVAIKYDLKGSRRNRFIPRAKAHQVTLDNNFLYDRQCRPIPMQYMMKRLLKIAIANDTLYLTKHSIIDYSLFVIIDPVKKTIRVGIIDYIQHYTLEKELESYLKQTISHEDPTIIPPEHYKQRFRTAMDKYFIALVPDQNQQLDRMLNTQCSAKEIKWLTKEAEQAGDDLRSLSSRSQVDTTSPQKETLE